MVISPPLTSKLVGAKMHTAIQTAVKKAGGMRALARAIGVSYQAIQSWTTRIPAERVLDVERATGIPREKLRPDLYAKK
jgi:DNA-binding transcriptional regulator YdaS (Cro superfamily)